MVSNKHHQAILTFQKRPLLRHGKGLALLVVVLLMGSCDRHVVFEQNLNLPGAVWHYQDTLVLEAQISDTVSLHNMYVNIRNTPDYPFSNFFMFLDIRLPDGTAMRDTLEMILAEPTGRWTGSGIGRIRANRFLFRTDVWFPQTGVYTFTMEQAMRLEELRGVSDVGLRISKK